MRIDNESPYAHTAMTWWTMADWYDANVLDVS